MRARFHTRRCEVRGIAHQVAKRPSISPHGRRYRRGGGHAQPAEHVDVPHRAAGSAARVQHQRRPRPGCSRSSPWRPRSDTPLPAIWLTASARGAVLLAGLVVTGLSALVAAWAATFSLLLVLRTVQALGTATAFPAGIALLRILDAEDRSDRPLPGVAWRSGDGLQSGRGPGAGAWGGVTGHRWLARTVSRQPSDRDGRHAPTAAPRPSRIEQPCGAKRQRHAQPDCRSTTAVFGVGALRGGLHGVLCRLLCPAPVAASVVETGCRRDRRRDGPDGDRVRAHHPDRGPDRPDPAPPRRHWWVRVACVSERVCWSP